MATKKDISLIKKGMQKDKHPAQLEQQEYIYALNANLSNESGNYINITNEHSNILSSKFKLGYKVIGFKNDINSNNTYFFLCNPITNISEIGYIPNTHYIENTEDIEIQCPECNYKNKLSEPLENIVQTQSQTYTTILSDCEENKCLNLSVLHPIKSIEIKTEKSFKNIYFTDNFNPPRYIQLNNLDIYSYEGEEVCGDDSGVINTCLACDKLRIFKQFNIPTLKPDSIVLGGQLLPGTYEFLIAYSDEIGNEISEYFSITNPISIFDENNRTALEPERTNFAIKLNVEGLDKKFSHYKIVVIQTNIKQETSYFEEGIHPINDNSVLYSSEQNKKRRELDSILLTNTHIEKWEGLTQSNGYLFGYGLTVKKEINLQPVVNLLGSFFRWQTHVAKEDLYKNGVSESKYKGFHRDESYPFAIVFKTNTGFSTSAFPLIGRPPTKNELELLPSNKDKASIQNINDSCIDQGILYRWQIYNSAETLGSCNIDSDFHTTTITEDITKICYLEEVGVAPGDEFTLTLTEGNSFTNLQDFISVHKDDCSQYPFCSFLYISNYPQTCTPNFDNCNTPELIQQTLEIGEIVGENISKTEKSFPEEYSRISQPQFCNLYQIDNSTGGILRDTAFEKKYMNYSYDSDTEIFTFKKVYKRDYNFANESCVYATNITNVETTSLPLPGYFHNYKGADIKADLETNKLSLIVGSNFTNYISKSALWYKGTTNSRSKFILEVTKQLDPSGDDNIAIDQIVRLDIFLNCSQLTASYSKLINLSLGEQFYIDTTSGNILIKEGSTGTITSITSPITSGEFYVSIDIPIVEEDHVLQNPEENPSQDIYTTRYRTSPVDGCFSIATRNIEYKNFKVSYDSIAINKKMVYKASCNFEIPQVKDCEAVPLKYGKFSYTESTENYPDNTELYNSSNLRILVEDLPSEYRDEFRDYFATGVSTDGTYILKPETNFACKPIRHFKFPDNKITPFMWESTQAPFVDSLIYPLGITVDENLINVFLDIAVKNNLITETDRNSIVSYEILRGDRTLDKGVVAKGLTYDMMKYTEGYKDVYYSNYPYNDLGADRLNLTSDRTANLPHPYGGTGNSNFTFHSPETDYNKISLPNLLKVEGYMFGSSKGYFDEVRNHPRMIILGNDAKTLATTLAVIESVAEIVIASSMALSNAQIWAVGGFTTGFSGGFAAYTAAGIIAGLGLLTGISSKVGKYRYEWLEAFRNMGSPKNLGYYYSSIGHYNYLQPLQEEGELIRNLQIAKNIKKGLRLTVTNEISGTKLDINNIDREQSVLLSTGNDFYLTYPAEYVNFDNGNVDFNNSSRFYESLANVCSTGRSPEIRRNIASMYVALKNYVPAQYGTIGSVKWLTTGHIGNLDQPSSGCLSIFGGDVYISRHTLKRKIPIFQTTLMGQADLTPFEYKFYSNIGTEPRFYINYEIENGSTSLVDQIFPDFDSDYELDCLTGNTGFYVKNPSKFYLYYYGIPNFLVETTINTNYRKSGLNPLEDYYPNQEDFMELTQETLVPIKNDNKFYYDRVYSKNVTPYNINVLPSTYSKELYDKLYDSPNGVMYSLPDNSENDLTDPWLIYKPLDSYQFPTEWGKLKTLKGIETAQVIGLFENQSVIFNAVDVMVDGITPEQRSLGKGGIFARRPVTFTQTDLGYAGSQSTEVVSCEFGHFFADAKRGQIFQMNPGGKGLNEISSYIEGKPSGMSNWFKEQLPFKILKTHPNANTDNSYNNVGLSMGWDSRYKRVFITKKDYLPKRNCTEYNEELGWVINETECGQDPDIKCPEGYTYNSETDKCEKINIISKCPEGYTYNSETDKCEKETSGCSEGLDIVFILDATASQGGAITNIKNAISTTIVPAIIDRFGSDYRLALIAVKDRRIAGQSLYDVMEPFSIANESTFLAQLNSIVAEGGAAASEPSDMALQAALDNLTAIDLNGNPSGSISIGEFRDISSKAIILVTDETPSGLSDSYEFSDWLHADSLADQAFSQEVQLFPYLTRSTEGAITPPIGTTPPSVAYLMRNYAIKSNGQYYFTPNGTGIAQGVVDAIVNNIDCKDEIDPINCSGCIDNGDICTCTSVVDPAYEDVLTPIDINDSYYFEEVSWTVAYSPIYGTWISYYDFKPNYYVNHQNYFQTGINNLTNEFGLWSHLLTNKSYQVFYGKKYGFEVEYPIKNDFITKTLNNIEIWTEARRNHNDYDYSFSPEITFNKAVIYNGVMNSGNLNLVPQKNNLAFTRNYPKTNNDNTQDILISNNDNFKWNFDYIFNRVISNLNNQTNWFWDINQIKKTINPHAVGFKGKRVLERMKGDYFISKLTYDLDSRYNLIFKFAVGETQV